MTPIISVQHLSKFYPNLKAVDDLSFSVEEGEVYGFLGQNGAGKSTTIRMLLTLVQPSAGRIELFGKELQRHRHEVLAQVGAVIERPDLYQYLSAYDNVRLLAQLSGLRPTREAVLRQLEVVGLRERAFDKAKTFSQGMKQRLGLACALIHNPRLLVLDEPTNGLDPQGIAEVRELLRRLSREEGKTVLVSSHLLSEVELVADAMIIIDRGRKVAEGKVRQLLNPADMQVELLTADAADARRKLLASSWAGAVQPAGDRLLLRMARTDVPRLARDLVAMNVDILALQPRHSLEDYFLSITQKADVATH
ncbi:ABC transporter ATP-binding protein [Flaviaesturariibacter flavus]|uniref:ABC transporter ATP-binding protein n=1 Tax=Flaviaesturariibacter flavus TaxID=2502780 RepID=A0A4R1BMZ7_9BACT|nr:ABC transporter ATP-binding protein [Flaviaesturariibacter flavus]TCJ18819.1 ABC transporter ATP-binding protein [Flaviaesturariibacter flavus]